MDRNSTYMVIVIIVWTPIWASFPYGREGWQTNLNDIIYGKSSTHLRFLFNLTFIHSHFVLQKYHHNSLRITVTFSVSKIESAGITRSWVCVCARARACVCVCLCACVSLYSGFRDISFVCLFFQDKTIIYFISDIHLCVPWPICLFLFQF